VREETIEKVRRRENGTVRTDSSMTDVPEVEQSFCLGRPDGWVINRKMKKIILLEFKRPSDSSESHFLDMWRVVEKQHSHSKGPWGPGGRSRVGGRCHSVVRRRTGRGSCQSL
jgi:hypothetical protein